MEIAKTHKRSLPKIDELYSDVQLTAKQNELNRLLNCEPKADWVREHPFAKGVKYLPIGVVEYLLTSIFVKWRVEVKSSTVIANSVLCHVRLHVQDPITAEWDWQDGVGAAPIQTEKGAAATDFGKVLTDAVMKAAPAAESYAVKDAAEKFGKIFGKDLNRRDFMPYTALDGKLDTDRVMATPDMVFHLRGLLKTSTLTHDEVDILQDKLNDGITVSEYETLRLQLSDAQETPLTRLQNGRNMSEKNLTQAVKERIGRED